MNDDRASARFWTGVAWATLLSIPIWMVIGTAIILTVGSCRTVQEAQRLDELTDDEFLAFKERTAGQISIIALAAIQEGDLSPEACIKLGEAMKGLAIGTTVPAGSSLMDSLDVEGYGAAVLGLALIELDSSLRSAGGLSGGWLTPRGEESVVFVAETLIGVGTKNLPPEE